MTIKELKFLYRDMLLPVFGEELRIDDSEESTGWVAVILDGEKEDFFFSLYGVDCVYLYWCNECFIFDKCRNGLVSSDTQGEIVYEGAVDIEKLPQMIFDLIMQLKDSVFVEKSETVKGRISSGYDYIKDYVVVAKAESFKNRYLLGNIVIDYI